MPARLGTLRNAFRNTEKSLRKVSEVDESVEAFRSRAVGMFQADLPGQRLPLRLDCPVALSISGGEDIARVNRWRTENVLAAQSKSVAWRKSFVKKRLEKGAKTSDSWQKRLTRKSHGVSKSTVYPLPEHEEIFGSYVVQNATPAENYRKAKKRHNQVLQNGAKFDDGQVQVSCLE